MQPMLADGLPACRRDAHLLPARLHICDMFRREPIARATLLPGAARRDFGRGAPRATPARFAGRKGRRTPPGGLTMKDVREFSEAEREATIAHLKLLPGETGKRWRAIFFRLRALKEAEARSGSLLPDRVTLLTEVDREIPRRPPK